MVSGAFALFIVCPRMAVMTNLIAKATQVSVVQIAIIGTVLSFPLIIAMAFIRPWGLMAALGSACSRIWGRRSSCGR